MQNLLTSSPVLDDYSVQYPHAMPTPYRCQVEESCKGGLESTCRDGYEGPLCSVCSLGYHKQLQSCTKCPSKTWITGQLSIIAVVVLILIAFLVRKSKTKFPKNRRQYLIDNFLSKLKILIGFYQVTYGLLEMFSYIKWPNSFEIVAKYSGMLQMNLLQVAPIHCLFPGLRVDAFGELFLMLTMNFTVIAAFGVVYVFRKKIILKNQSLEDEEKSTKISQTKEVLYKNTFFFLYVTYLSTFSKTASVLPFACRTLCRDKNEELCNEYVKADYNIKCQGPTYNHWLIMAYISMAYIFTLPAFSFIALWRRRKLSTGDDDNGSETEMIAGLRFLFENYKPHSWYWELVEMSRKVILTSSGAREQVLYWFGMGYCWYVWNAFFLDQTHTRRFRKQINVDISCCYSCKPGYWCCEQNSCREFTKYGGQTHRCFGNENTDIWCKYSCDRFTSW